MGIRQNDTSMMNVAVRKETHALFMLFSVDIDERLFIMSIKLYQSM